jgi:SAM-dependent methyltransferase
MASQKQGHKWFAVYWDRMVKMEAPALQALRDHALSGLSGEVLEIGAGNGANFARYPAAVTRVVATEPDPYMLERAEKAAARLGRNIEVRLVPAEQLPFDDESFDAVVSVLVLCSVTDQRQALSEIRGSSAGRSTPLHRTHPLPLALGGASRTCWRPSGAGWAPAATLTAALPTRSRTPVSRLPTSIAWLARPSAALSHPPADRHRGQALRRLHCRLTT